MSQMQQNPGRAVGAFVLIGLGIFFLLSQFIALPSLGQLWPFFIIVPGLAFLYFAYTGSRDLASLAIPGSIVTGTGLILFYQNSTGRWESWAYIWTLYPVFLGLGLMFLGRRTGDESTRGAGRNFVTWGGIAFLAFGAFFEIFIFGGFGLSRHLLPVLLPALLILVGAWLLLKGQGRDRRGHFKYNGKAKRGDRLFTGAPVTGSRRRTPASDRLRAEIDAVLAEDKAEDTPVPAGDGPEDDEPADAGPGNEPEDEPAA